MRYSMIIVGYLVQWLPIYRGLDWKQPNGFLKDMVCRSLLLLLESKGFIKLPARKFTPQDVKGDVGAESVRGRFRMIFIPTDKVGQ